MAARRERPIPPNKRSALSPAERDVYEKSLKDSSYLDDIKKDQRYEEIRQRILYEWSAQHGEATPANVEFQDFMYGTNARGRKTSDSLDERIEKEFSRTHPDDHKT